MRKSHKMFFATSVLMFILTSNVSANSGQKAQFSTDCKAWKTVDDGDKSIIKSGFIKAANGLLYFDFSKKIYLQSGEVPAVFYKINDEMNVLVASSITSYTLKIKTDDTIKDVLWTLAGLGKELMDRSQWRLRTKNGLGEISYFFSESDKCTHAPTARAISCTINKCVIGPGVKDPDNLTRVCTKELKLLESSRLTNITNACKVFTNENTYAVINSTNESFKKSCGISQMNLPTLAQLKKTCDEALKGIEKLK